MIDYKCRLKYTPSYIYSYEASSRQLCDGILFVRLIWLETRFTLLGSWKKNLVRNKKF